MELLNELQAAMDKQQASKAVAATYKKVLDNAAKRVAAANAEVELHQTAIDAIKAKIDKAMGGKGK